MKKIFYPKV